MLCCCYVHRVHGARTQNFYAENGIDRLKIGCYRRMSLRLVDESAYRVAKWSRCDGSSSIFKQGYNNKNSRQQINRQLPDSRIDLNTHNKSFTFPKAILI